MMLPNPVFHTSVNSALISSPRDMHFAEGSRVLFVGEGDFSFVTSLTQQDGCAGIHLTATSLQEELSERARRNVEVLAKRGVLMVLFC